ncbi:hypothetical protein SAMN02910369_00878 [Lachnospiraceae bacterium NE2001]|nr:hypothetical protein SAMN02910369_00878 [Lachnospiraceae bacterium NE2001]
MGKFLFPDEYYDSTYSINFEDYYKKGYRGIIFDIDNTLVPHNAMHDDKSRALFKRLKEIGFRVCFVSNNKEPRVKKFNDEINCQYVYKAGKPKASGFYEAMRKMKTNRKNTFFVGDQLFTDIWGANNARIHCILVKQIDKKEEIQIVLKRILEKPIIKLYLKKSGKRS